MARHSRPKQVEYQPGSAALARLVRHLGYTPENASTVLLSGVQPGLVRIKVAGFDCPPNRAVRATFSPDGDRVFDCIPPAMPINLGEFLEWDDDGEPITPEVEAEPHAEPPGLPCLVNMLDLMNYAATLAKLEGPAEKAPNRGGRPGKWGWYEALEDLTVAIYEGAVVIDPTAFAKFIGDWFAKSDAKGGPDERDIRRRAKSLYLKCEPNQPRGE